MPSLVSVGSSRSVAASSARPAALPSTQARGGQSQGEHAPLYRPGVGPGGPPWAPPPWPPRRPWPPPPPEEADASWTPPAGVGPGAWGPPPAFGPGPGRLAPAIGPGRAAQAARPGLTPRSSAGSSSASLTHLSGFGDPDLGFSTGRWYESDVAKVGAAFGLLLAIAAFAKPRRPRRNRRRRR